MEANFEIPVQGITTKVIISEWCYVKTMIKLQQVNKDDPDNIMRYMIKNASPLFVYFGYVDYCNRSAMPEIFSFDDIKKAIAGARGVPGFFDTLIEIGKIFEQLDRELK